jgi:hypothetical protein
MPAIPQRLLQVYCVVRRVSSMRDSKESSSAVSYSPEIATGILRIESLACGSARNPVALSAISQRLLQVYWVESLA